MQRPQVHTVLILAIALSALGFRLVQLDRRPMHNDEANQAVRCGSLLETGRYRYDPDEHHGPSLYYLTLPVAWLTSGTRFADTTEATFRIVPVLAGVALILLMPLVADGIGRWSAVFAAILAAVSPAMVFYNRFYIQESLLTLFTFGLIAAAWRLARSGRSFWALITGVFAGLMYSTKETCVIAFGSMLAAALTVLAAPRTGPGLRSRVPSRQAVRNVAVAAVTACVVSAAFFSSFFTNPHGPVDSLRSFAVYLDRAAGETVHVHPWFYYMQMIIHSRYGRGPAWSEGLIVALAVVGALAVLTRRLPAGSDGSMARFLAVYAILITAVYSAIPYKTPWCMLSFLHAMMLLAGVGASSLFQFVKPRAAKVALALVLTGCTAHLARQAVLANSRFCADPRNPYVYAHTSIDLLKLVDRMDELAAVHPRGHGMFVQVIAHPHQTWPLPWYLRRFRAVGYWTDPADVPDAGSVPVIITSPAHTEALAGRTQDRYQLEYFGLRPEVLLAVYIRRDLWEKFLDTRR